MVFGWLKRNRDLLDHAEVAPVEKKFHEHLEDWVEELDWLERDASAFLSTDVYSRLRVINDLFRETVEFTKTYSVQAEEEYILESTLTKYIPDSLNVFRQLPANERSEGGKADLMLLEQCEDFERSVRLLNESMVNRVKNDLSAQTTFVENRFAEPV